MSFSLYFKSAIWDLLLLAVAAISLTYVLMDGFFVAESLQYSPIPGVVAAVALVVLMCVAFTKNTALIGGIIFAVVMLGSWVVGAALTPSEQVLSDTESNYMIFIMVVTLTPTLCFLVSRRRVGTAFLFIVGAFLLAFMQFYYEKYEIVWSLLFIFASLALIVYRNYQTSAETSSSSSKLSFIPGAGVAVGAVLVSLGVGCAIWFGIVAPLNPPRLEVKIFNEDRALETISARGVSNVYQTPNLDLTSKDTNDGERTTDDLSLSDDGRKVPANDKSEKKNEQQESNGSFMGISWDSLQDMFNAQDTEEHPIWMYFLWLLIPLAIVAYFVGRRIWRTKRLKKLQEQGPQAVVTGVYTFLASKFGKLGLGIPVGLTTLEHAQSCASSMERFNTEAGVEFTELAAVYSAVTYGKHEPTQEEADKFAAYYSSFWKAARKYLGNFKYFRKSFGL